MWRRASRYVASVITTAGQGSPAGRSLARGPLRGTLWCPVVVREEASCSFLLEPLRPLVSNACLTIQDLVLLDELLVVLVECRDDRLEVLVLLERGFKKCFRSDSTVPPVVRVGNKRPRWPRGSIASRTRCLSNSTRRSALVALSGVHALVVVQQALQAA